MAEVVPEDRSDKGIKFFSKTKIFSLKFGIESKNLHFRFTILSLLPISGFVLDEKFQQNASKFAIFDIYENPKLLFPFFIFHFMLLYFFH